MTVAVKDNIDTAGIRTACGSRLFVDRIPNDDAPVVDVLRDAGAIIVGKAAMMELAFGVRSLDADRRPVPQSVGPRPRARWIERRVGSGGGARSLRRRARDRYRRLDPHAGGLLRRHRACVRRTGSSPTAACFRSACPSTRSARWRAASRTSRGCSGGHRRLRPGGSDLRRSAARLHRFSTAIATWRDCGSRCRATSTFTDIDPEVEAAVRGFADTLAGAGATLVEVDVEGAEEAHRHATTMILSRRLRASCRRARRQARAHFARRCASA